MADPDSATATISRNFDVLATVNPLRLGSRVKQCLETHNGNMTRRAAPSINYRHLNVAC
jgi:hypothetical protein